MFRLTAIFFFLSFPLLLSAQSLSFFSGPFPNAQELARSQQKMLMLEFFEPGCEVCGYMQDVVFADPEVVRFFDQHVIAYQVDAIHSQPMLVEAYEAYAFPTLLFFDPQGNTIVRYQGGMTPTAFLRFAEGALNHQEYQRRISENPYDGEALAGFLAVLEINDPETAFLMASDYLEFVEEENYSEPFNFDIISHFISDYRSREFQYIFAHQEEFQHSTGLVQLLNTGLGTLWKEAIQEVDHGKKDLYADMATEVMNQQNLWQDETEDTYRAGIEAAFLNQTADQ